MSPRRVAWGAIAFIVWIWGTILLLAMCGACHLPARGSPRPREADQARAAVLIETRCGFVGSGVIVSPAQVLTAAHVLKFDERIPAEIAKCPGPYLVTDADGRRRFADAEVITNRDVARLVLYEGQPAFTGTRVRPRVKGIHLAGVVCVYTAQPRRGRMCGTITAYDPAPTGGVQFDIDVQHGNSGAGAYDERGNLIGVVVWKRNDGKVGGMATGLANRKWLVP